MRRPPRGTGRPAGVVPRTAGGRVPPLATGRASGWMTRPESTRQGEVALVVSWHGRRWRSAIGAVLVIGILGGVALAALAGARRTASAYSEYLRGSDASDVLINTPVPGLERPEAIAHLPGVVSSANYVGLFASPVLHGQENDDFQLTGVFGSVDGRYFTQDRATVDEGRLPRLDATDELALTKRISGLFGVGLGDR